MKKLFSLVVILILSIAVMGCNVTKTESYTDENGNTTTTTTVKDLSGTTTTTETTDADGNVVQDDEVAAEPMIEAQLMNATLTFVNLSGVDIAEMYFGIDCAKTEEWGDEVLGDDAPLLDQEQIAYKEGFTYSEDYPLWDFMVFDETGDGIVFEGIDVTVAEDPSNIAIIISYSEDEQDFVIDVK